MPGPHLRLQVPAGALLLIAAVVLGACSGPPAHITAREGNAGASGALPWQATPRKGDPPWLATHEALVKRVPGSDPGVLFVGDSILFAWPSTGASSWTLFAPWRPADIGVAGDTTQNVLWRVDHGEVADIDPKVTVVMIGTNDLAQYPAGQVARGIEAVVSDLRQHLPHTRMVLLGMLPTDPPGTARHRKPPEVNRSLAARYAKSSVQFIDLSSSFAEPDGTLRATLYHSVCLTGIEFCDTLVHPSAAGYAVIAQVVVPVVSALAR